MTEASIASSRDKQAPPNLLSEMRQLPSSRSRVHDRAVFLALRDQIAETLAAGYTVKAVWELLRSKGRLGMAYSTFREHCLAAGLQRSPRGGRTSVGRGVASRVDATPKRNRFSHSSTPDPQELYGENNK